MLYRWLPCPRSHDMAFRRWYVFLQGSLRMFNGFSDGLDVTRWMSGEREVM